jgi:hypothetical protein
MGDIDLKIEERICKFRDRRERRDSPANGQNAVALKILE